MSTCTLFQAAETLHQVPDSIHSTYLRTKFQNSLTEHGFSVHRFCDPESHSTLSWQHSILHVSSNLLLLLFSFAKSQDNYMCSLYSNSFLFPQTSLWGFYRHQNVDSVNECLPKTSNAKSKDDFSFFISTGTITSIYPTGIHRQWHTNTAFMISKRQYALDFTPTVFPFNGGESWGSPFWISTPFNILHFPVHLDHGKCLYACIYTHGEQSPWKVHLWNLVKPL